MSDKDETEKYENILDSISEALAQINQLIVGVEETISETSESSSKGISLLDVKNHQLLDYVINLMYIFLHKLNGNSIEGNEAIDRLVEIRTVLERIRPIEKKMQYQIDKLIKAVNAEVPKSNDPLSFKPNIGELDEDESSGSEDDKDSDAKEASKKTKDAKYVPPRLVAMPYNEGESSESRAVERAKKRALSSSLVQDLQQQYSMAPEEIRDEVGMRKKKQSDEMEHRKEFEEEHMVRLQMTKKQKQAAKKSRASATIHSLLDFGDYGAINRTPKSADKAKKSGKKFKGLHGKKKKFRKST